MRETSLISITQSFTGDSKSKAVFFRCPVDVIFSASFFDFALSVSEVFANTDVTVAEYVNKVAYFIWKSLLPSLNINVVIIGDCNPSSIRFSSLSVDFAYIPPTITVAVERYLAKIIRVKAQINYSVLTVSISNFIEVLLDTPDLFM